MKVKFIICFLLFFNYFIFNAFNKYKSIKNNILRYPKLNEIKLNYFERCGEIFKYKKNNKRDLVMFSYKSTENDFYSTRSLLIYNVIDSIKKNIPNANIICFVPNNSINSSLVIQVLQKNKVLIIKENDFLNMELVSSRFLYEYEYLKKNINSYDRIIHADLTDIFFFSDIFKTLKPNELIINKQCGGNSSFGEKGHSIFNLPNRNWFYRSFGDNKTLVNIFKKINPIVINAGLIMGDSKEYFKFLDILNKNFNYTKALNYGYDQILINVLYYTGKFKEINIKFDLCSQRSCFVPNLIFERKNKKLYFKNGCSPVIIHKNYPIY